MADFIAWDTKYDVGVEYVDKQAAQTFNRLNESTL